MRQCHSSSFVSSVPRTQVAHTESFSPRTQCRQLRFDASIEARRLDTSAPRQSRAHQTRPVIPGRSPSWCLFPYPYVAGHLRRERILVVSVSCGRPRDAEEINAAVSVERTVIIKGPTGTIETGLCVTLCLTILHADTVQRPFCAAVGPLTDAPDACSCYVHARGGRGGSKRDPPCHPFTRHTRPPGPAVVAPSAPQPVRPEEAMESPSTRVDHSRGTTASRSGGRPEAASPQAARAVQAPPQAKPLTQPIVRDPSPTLTGWRTPQPHLIPALASCEWCVPSVPTLWLHNR